MKKALMAATVAGVLVLSGCSFGESGGGSDETGAPGATAEQVVVETPTVESSEGGSCFSVAEIGTGLSLTWELVVAARGATDQKDYLEDLMDEGNDLYEDIEDDLQCEGATDLTEFNYELSILNLDITLGDDTDEHYQKIADLGNDLLKASDDEGYDWGYEFVSDAAEIDP